MSHNFDDFATLLSQQMMPMDSGFWPNTAGHFGIYQNNDNSVNKIDANLWMNMVNVMKSFLVQNNNGLIASDVMGLNPASHVNNSLSSVSKITNNSICGQDKQRITMLPNPTDLFTNYQSAQILQFISDQQRVNKNMLNETIPSSNTAADMNEAINMCIKEEYPSQPDIFTNSSTLHSQPAIPPMFFDFIDKYQKTISEQASRSVNGQLSNNSQLTNSTFKLDEELLNFSKLSTNASSSSPSLSHSTFSIPNLLSDDGLKREDTDYHESFTFHSSNGSLSPPSASSDRLSPPQKKMKAIRQSSPAVCNMPSDKNNNITEQKQYTCHLCTKIYYSMSALKMHIRTHTLPCKCNICGKAFSRMWLLNGHIRTHTGEKPFSCNVCSRAFADRSNLRAHMQTHSDVKRYKCEKCGKTFSRMGLLTKHKSSTNCGISTSSILFNSSDAINFTHLSDSVKQSTFLNEMNAPLLSINKDSTF